jgi:hypothetical protein
MAFASRKGIDQKEIDEKGIALVMTDWADQAVKWARETYQLQLDYSMASLVGAEEVLDRVAGGWMTQGLTPTRSEMNELTKLMGYYIGEVLRRQYGCKWIWDHRDMNRILVLLIPSPGDMRCDPAGHVYKRLNWAGALSSVVCGAVCAHSRAGEGETCITTQRDQLGEQLRLGLFW